MNPNKIIESRSVWLDEGFNDAIQGLTYLPPHSYIYANWYAIGYDIGRGNNVGDDPCQK